MGRTKLQAINLSVMALLALSVIRPAAASQQYTVKKGDNLWLIARRYSTHVADIKRVNHADFNKPLPLGMKLTIPVSAPPKAKAKPHKATAVRKKAHAVTKSAKHVAPKPLTPKHETAQASEPSPAKTQVADASVASSSRSRLVHRALAYRGTRYRRGGTGRRGFDCSGFTRFIYAKDGVSLPHSSRAQSRIGKRVSRSELIAGDLVFFACNRRGISHVGMYIGGGQFVHASNHSGGVRVDSLSSGYYAPRYRGARRVR